MNTQCHCKVGGAACAYATCRPFGDWTGECGYFHQTLDENGEEKAECSPYCCPSM